MIVGSGVAVPVGSTVVSDGVGVPVSTGVSVIVGEGDWPSVTVAVGSVVVSVTVGSTVVGVVVGVVVVGVGVAGPRFPKFWPSHEGWPFEITRLCIPALLVGKVCSQPDGTTSYTR